MKKQHFTTSDIFYQILIKLKESNLIPSIIDYSLGCNYPVRVDTDEWDCVFRVEFGTNEGIFLSIYLEGNISKDIEKAELGTFKTLYESKEAYKAMSDLGVEFVFALSEFVDANPDSFCWTGYSLRSDGDQDRLSMWCGTHQSAMKRLRHYLSTHPDRSVTIIRNDTEAQKKYTNKDIAKIDTVLSYYTGGNNGKIQKIE